MKAEMLNFSFVVIGTFLGTFPSRDVVLKSNFHFENQKKSSKLQKQIPNRESSFKKVPIATNEKFNISAFTGKKLIS